MTATATGSEQLLGFYVSSGGGGRTPESRVSPPPPPPPSRHDRVATGRGRYVVRCGAVRCGVCPKNLASSIYSVVSSI